MDWSLVCLQFLFCELACKLHLCHFHHLSVVGGCMLRCFDRWPSFASIFFLTCTSLLGSSFGSHFHGYSIGHWRPIFWQESSVIFNSFRSTALNLSASHSQGLAATPIVSVVQKSVMSMGVGTFTLKTQFTCSCFLGVAPNMTQPRGDCLAIRLAASLVSPVCSLGWSMPTSRSIGPFLRWMSPSLRPKIPATWLSFISEMSLLIHRMPTAVTVWITFRLTSDLMRTLNSFVINSSSSPPTFAMVMVTFFPIRPSSSATDNLIKLTWAPGSRSRFPCFLTFSDPRISLRMTGRIGLFAACNGWNC